MGRMIARSIYLVWTTSPSLSAAVLCTTIVLALIPSVRLVLSKELVDSVIRVAAGAGGFRDAVIPVLCALGAVGVFSIMFSQATGTFTILLGRRVGHAIHQMILRHGLSLDLSYFEQPEFYDKMQRARGDGAHRPLAVVALLSQLAQSIATFITLVIVLARFRWWAVPVVVLTAAPHVWGLCHFARRGYSLRRDRTHVVRTSEYVASVLSSLEHVKEIKLFRAGMYFLERHSQLFMRLYNDDYSISCRSGMINGGLAVAAAVSYIAFYAYAAQLASTEQMSIGTLVLLTGAYQTSQNELGAMARATSALYEHALFLGSVFEYLGLRSRLYVVTPAAQIPRLLRTGLRLRDVSFKYPGTEAWALRDVRMALGPSECVAVVGPNGAGKSSLIKLICRFYDPTGGEILLDGVDIRKFDVDEYQERIGAVFQDFCRYQMTAYMNIAIGRLNPKAEPGHIREAARMSGADRVLQAVPGGYDAMLGRHLTDGHELSAGEWQTVGLARTIMRDPQVLLLDEPTAMLDAEREEALVQTLERMIRGRSCLLVSHRLSTARIANRIIVLDAGRVVEEGTHDHLVTGGGRYASMFKLQAARYTDAWCARDRPRERVV